MKLKLEAVMRSSVVIALVLALSRIATAQCAVEEARLATAEACDRSPTCAASGMERAERDLAECREGSRLKQVMALRTKVEAFAATASKHAQAKECAWCGDETEKLLGAGSTRTAQNRNPITATMIEDAMEAHSVCLTRAATVATEYAERQRRLGNERLAESERKAKEDAEEDAIRKDKTAMGVVFGAILCEWGDKRAGVRAELAAQRKYAAEAGVADRRVLYSLGLQLRNADEAIAEERKNLRDFRGVRAAACSSRQVRELRACNDDATTCKDDRQRAMTRFVPDVNARDRMDEIEGRVPGVRPQYDDPDRFVMPPVRQGQ